MMDRIKRAQTFRSLHVKGDPVVLYNIWDAGGANALVEAGAQAIATGSWSVAAAHGYADGEAIPLERVVWIVERIAATVNAPLSVDFEGGFAVEPAQVAANVRRIIAAGAIGINLEDRVVSGDGLYAVQEQAERINAVRQVAREDGSDLFINARQRTKLQAQMDSSFRDSRIKR